MSDNAQTAREVSDLLAEVSSVPNLKHCFQENDGNLPDLGGYGSTAKKRNHHRRAYIRLVSDTLRCNALMMCLPLHSLDVLEDLGQSDAELRLLVVGKDLPQEQRALLSRLGRTQVHRLTENMTDKTRKNMLRDYLNCADEIAERITQRVSHISF